MQISMSLDEKNADIDVDYRSSKFPAALFNGHLTSSNSDVRAGNNFERHTGRWIGLQDWWANWFSLSLIDKDDLSEEDKSASIPKYPPKGKEQIHEAANDFFTSWLVEQNPALAMSYVSSNAFECLERPTDEPLDAGMAPFQMLVGLKKSNEKLGKIENLTQIFTGIRVAQPDLRVVEQPYHSAFVLYDVPESRALEFICSNRGLPENEVPQGSRNRYGKYYATAMFIQAPNKPGETLAVLWTKENGYWKIISWESEPETDMSDVPDLRTPIVVGSVPRVQGKPEQISAAADFLDAWFIEKDYDRTLGFFSEECFDCMNLFLQEDEQPFSGKKELSDRLRLGLERTAEAMGSFDRLDEVIRAFEPVNPDHPMVTHEHESTYTLISVPDYVAGNYGCRYRLSGGPLLPAPEQPAFGNHYVLGFHVKTYTGEPAVLFTLWSLRSGQWKITAFHIERP
jgi:hypothetical protein